MKICVLIMFLVMPWIERVGDWALGWTEGNEQLQIVFVMMLFPLIMNAMQYYIIDSFIKKAISGDDIGPASPADCGVYDQLSIGEGEDSDSDSDDDLHVPRKSSPDDVRLSRRDRSSDREYDPVMDGDSQTVISSGSSGAVPTERGRLLSKDLFPTE